MDEARITHSEVRQGPWERKRRSEVSRVERRGTRGNKPRRGFESELAEERCW